jgi:hypothetical protein
VTLFPTECEAPNALWGLIEKWVFDKFSQAGVSALLMIAVSHSASYASQRAVQLVGSLLSRLNFTIDKTLHPAVLELLKFPDLQGLALSLLQKISDMKSLSALLIKAGQIISQDDPQTAGRLAHQYIDGPGGWMYLPMFFSCVWKSDDRQKFGIEIAERIISEPDKFSHFPSVSHWFWYLYRFLDSCEVEKESFGMCFARLIDRVQQPSEVGPMLASFFTFLAANGEMRWLRSRIFKFLLREEVMSQARFSAVFPYVFDYLFVQFVGTDRLHIVVDLNDEGLWNDIEIAESLVRGLDTDQAIHDIEYAHKLAYIFAQLLRFGKSEYLVKFLRIKADDEMMARGIKMILHVADHLNIKVLPEYQPVFDDDDDSNALQTFVFENALLEKLAIITKNLGESVAAFQTRRGEMLGKIANEREALLSTVKEFMTRQKSRIDADKADRQQALESFIIAEANALADT